MEQLSLTGRAYDRILKFARTTTDLANTEKIEAPHLLEAIQYRSLDRTVFYTFQRASPIRAMKPPSKFSVSRMPPRSGETPYLPEDAASFSTSGAKAPPPQLADRRSLQERVVGGWATHPVSTYLRLQRPLRTARSDRSAHLSGLKGANVHPAFRPHWRHHSQSLPQ